MTGGNFIEDHGPLLLGVGGAALLLVVLKSRAGVSLPAGMGAAISNSPAPYTGGGAIVPQSSAASDAQVQMQLSQQQFQQQILLLNAQTQSQILASKAQADQQQQLIAAQSQAEMAAGHAQMLDNAALINKEAQAKNNVFTGEQGWGIVGTAITQGIKAIPIIGQLF